ncbi:MAG: hypothetical protein U0R19_35330 [Bryobacteraceae bacterium]
MGTVAWFIGCDGGPGVLHDPQQEKREVLFLLDLSNSTQLAENDMDSALRIAIDRAPEAATIHVFPLHANTRSASRLFGATFGSFDSERKRTASQTELGRDLMNQLQAARNDKGPHRKRTCIVDSLLKVSQFANEAKSSGHNLRTVFLSDMVEDCGPMNARQSPEDLAESVLVDRFGKDYRKVIQLKGARVTICQPGNSVAGVSPEKSVFGNLKVSDQREFWRAVFVKAGLTSEVEYPADRESCALAVWR